MPRTKPFAELAAKVEADPERRARIALEKRAMEDALALAALRSLQTESQQIMARFIARPQAPIMQTEHEEDLYLSALRDHVAELGGELEVSAVFPDGKVTLVPVER